MNIHKHVKTTPVSRWEMVRRHLEEGQPYRRIGIEMGVSVRTVGNWVRRYREAGIAGLQDRSSRPHRSPRCLPAVLRERIVTMRRTGLGGDVIARQLGMSQTTVSRELRRQKLSRASALQEAVPIVRYERATPGSLVHLDVKKIPRFVEPGPYADPYRAERPKKARQGFACVFAAVDDHSRVAMADILPDERATSASAFLEATVAWFRERGVMVEEVLTDNGPCFKARHFRATCQRLGVIPRRTRRYRPQTNGKVERFNRTLSQEWVYAREYPSSADRDQLLPTFLTYDNEHRPHRGIHGAVPISRLTAGGTTS
jgi:transposase InsO family protein